MKYHALFVIFEKKAKFETVVCCKLEVALYGLTLLLLGMTFASAAYTFANNSEPNQAQENVNTW